MSKHSRESSFPLQIACIVVYVIDSYTARRMVLCTASLKSTNTSTQVYTLLVVSFTFLFLLRSISHACIRTRTHTHTMPQCT